MTRSFCSLWLVVGFVVVGWLAPPQAAAWSDSGVPPTPCMPPAFVPEGDSLPVSLGGIVVHHPTRTFRESIEVSLGRVEFGGRVERLDFRLERTGLDERTLVVPATRFEVGQRIRISSFVCTGGDGRPVPGESEYAIVDAAPLASSLGTVSIGPVIRPSRLAAHVDVVLTPSADARPFLGYSAVFLDVDGLVREGAREQAFADPTVVRLAVDCDTGDGLAPGSHVARLDARDPGTGVIQFGAPTPFTLVCPPDSEIGTATIPPPRCAGNGCSIRPGRRDGLPGVVCVLGALGLWGLRRRRDGVPAAR